MSKHITDSNLTRAVLILLLTSVFYCNIPAQSKNFADRLANTGSNISGAFTSVLEWYDIPMGVAYTYRNVVGNNLTITPGALDKEISEDFGNNKNISPGSMDKEIIPRTIYLSRLAITAGLNIFTNLKISQESYRNTFLFEKSLLYTYTLTEITKNLIHRQRPDGSDNRSFFSGHASTTFAAATFLYLELNDFYNDWDVTADNSFLRNTFKATTFSVLYGWSGYVGYSRIHDKKHYLSDVLVGAAVGTLVSVFVYDSYVNKEMKFLDQFSFQASGKTLGLSFNTSF
jgi:hypothetical protein